MVMRNVRWIVMALALASAVGACGSSEDDLSRPTPKVCTPGSTQACLGPGACSGAQVCNAKGTQWGDCACGGGTGGSAGASGSGGASGSTASGGVAGSTGGSGGATTGGTAGAGGSGGSGGASASGGTGGTAGAGGTGGTNTNPDSDPCPTTASGGPAEVKFDCDGACGSEGMATCQTAGCTGNLYLAVASADMPAYVRLPEGPGTDPGCCAPIVQALDVGFGTVRALRITVDPPWKMVFPATIAQRLLCDGAGGVSCIISPPTLGADFLLFTTDPNAPARNLHFDLWQPGDVCP